jgi:hypothetical protein
LLLSLMVTIANAFSRHIHHNTLNSPGRASITNGIFTPRYWPSSSFALML